MAGRSESADFVEALARGLDILQAFDALHPRMTMPQIADAVDLTRPTVRRLLIRLQELGFIRQHKSEYELTPRVLDLGSAYVESLGMWDIARPHLIDLVGRTGNGASSMTQLEGSDIIYTARVSVPKIIAFRVEIGTRFPAAVTSQGKVLLAYLAPEEARRAVELPSRSHVRASPPNLAALAAELATARDRGWALADEELAPGIRSIAAPVRDEQGIVTSAVNVTVHAAETSRQTLGEGYLPHLLKTAGDISADWARWRRRPHVDLGQ